MAPKRPTPVSNPQFSSSSEEETTSNGEEEDGESSSEDDQTQKPQKSSSPQPTQKKPDSSVKQPKSESESGDESDSESEEVAASNVKSTKSRVVTGQSTAKRANEAERDAKDSKRLKTKDAESSGAFEKAYDAKKQLFQRLWTDEDEVALLKGITLFIEKKGTDPAKDMSAFFDFVKKSLHLNVALSQVKDKVMRLKRKFENQASKGKKGEDKTFSKPHDQEVFELSKKIWGKEGLLGKSKSLVPSNEIKMEKQVGSKEMRKFDNGVGNAAKQIGSKEIAKFDKVVGMASIEEHVIKRGLDMLDGAKRAEMEEKWREMHVNELELFVKQIELISEQAKLMLAAYKST